MKNKNILVLSSLILGLCVVTSPLLARERDLTISSMQIRGMGGAGVAIVRNEHSLYVNPAGLRKAKFDLNFPRFRVEGNEDILSESSKLSSVLSGSNEQDRIDDIKDLVPLKMGIGLGIVPAVSLTMPGFGIGTFAQNNVLIEFKNKVSPRIEFSVDTDTAIYAGYAQNFQFLGQDLDVGISGGFLSRSIAYDAKTGNRTFVLESSEFLETVDGGGDIEADSATATGLGFNAGIIGNVATPIGKGTWGFAFKNLLGTLSGDREVSGNTKSFDVELPLKGTVGVGLDTSLPYIGDFFLAADYDLISNAQDFFLRTHMGIEKKILGRLITLRAGLNQGYIVAGAGIDLYVFQINYLMDTVELGDKPGEKPLTTHVIEFGFLF